MNWPLKNGGSRTTAEPLIFTMPFARALALVRKPMPNLVEFVVAGLILVGAGAFGIAFLCKHKYMNSQVVVKALATEGLDRDVDDVFSEALALGARAVLVGRPYLWALAVGGENGVRRMLESMRDELKLAMALSGVGSIREIGPSLVAPAPASAGGGR